MRTVYRDIETINQAGIPVISYQGVNGGIGIAEGFRLDKNVLTFDELASITVALKSVTSSYSDAHTRAVLEKIKGIVPRGQSESFKIKTDHIFIDFSPWGDDSRLKTKVSSLKEAILTLKPVLFTYCSARGQTTSRSVDPYTLVLKGHNWYLYGYCRLRQEFRLFKVSRMKDIEIQNENYQRADINLENIPWDREWHGKNKIDLVLKFDEKVRAAVEEWFGIENVLPGDSGGCLVKAAFPEDDWLYGFILSFGHSVEVIEPERIRERIRDRAAGILNIYSGE